MNKIIKSLYSIFLCTIIVAGSCASTLEAARGNRSRNRARMINNNRRKMAARAAALARSKHSRDRNKAARNASQGRGLQSRCRGGICPIGSRPQALASAAPTATVAPVVGAPVVAVPAPGVIPTAVATALPVAVATPLPAAISKQYSFDDAAKKSSLTLTTEPDITKQGAIDLLIHVSRHDSSGTALENTLKSMGGPVMDKFLTELPPAIKEQAIQKSILVPANSAQVKDVLYVNTPAIATASDISVAYTIALERAKKENTTNPTKYNKIVIPVAPATLADPAHQVTAEVIVKAVTEFLKKNKGEFLEVVLLVDHANFNKYESAIKDIKDGWLARRITFSR